MGAKGPQNSKGLGGAATGRSGRWLTRGGLDPRSLQAQSTSQRREMADEEAAMHRARRKLVDQQ